MDDGQQDELYARVEELGDELGEKDQSLIQDIVSSDKDSRAEEIQDTIEADPKFIVYF